MEFHEPKALKRDLQHRGCSRFSEPFKHSVEQLTQVCKKGAQLAVWAWYFQLTNLKEVMKNTRFLPPKGQAENDSTGGRGWSPTRQGTLPFSMEAFCQVALSPLTKIKDQAGNFTSEQLCPRWQKTQSIHREEKTIVSFNQ